MFEKMTQMIRGKGKRLVFTEGEDPRIQHAAQKLVAEGLLQPILLGNLGEIQKVAATEGVNLAGMELISPLNHPRFNEMADALVELRKGKQTADECFELLKKPNYFGTMLVKMGLADGLVGGATYSTADTVRPALQIVKTKPGCNIVSSFMVLSKESTGERYAMADCAINLFPTEDEVVEIALETGKAARLFDIQPVVALLSYSTMGSGKGESPEKMRGATAKLKGMGPDFPVDGELQFDAAFAPEVAKVKAPHSPVAGKANTFIFPDINAGNIGYKMAQRLGGFEAFGPILLGLNAPINDLSRGCTSDEVYKLAIITAATS